MKYTKEEIDFFKELASICPGDFYQELEDKPNELSTLASKLEKAKVSEILSQD